MGFWEYDNKGFHSYVKNGEEIYPAYMISVATGIRVHTNWKSTKEINTIIKNRKNTDVDYNDMYDRLVSLNPILKNIKITNPYHKFDLCLGVISKFTYHDIKHFIEKWRSGKLLSETKAVNTLRIEFGYIPSENTIITISDNIDLAKRNMNKYFSKIHEGKNREHIQK